MARWNIPQAYAAFPEWAQVEEGVAHAYEAWAKDRYKVSGALQRIFQRIKNILEALRNGLTGLGFKSVDGIFRDIERGVVGKRLVRERGDPGVPSNDGELFRKSIMQTMERPTGGEAAFALQRDPRTAAERQRVMQGFIARGQPLDRAIRMPFDWVGGVDAEGRWNPGRWFFDQTSRTHRDDGQVRPERPHVLAERADGDRTRRPDRSARPRSGVCAAGAQARQRRARDPDGRRRGLEDAGRCQDRHGRGEGAASDPHRRAGHRRRHGPPGRADPRGDRRAGAGGRGARPAVA